MTVSRGVASLVLVLAIVVGLLVALRLFAFFAGG
jgi:hypothetical protein